MTFSIVSSTAKTIFTPSASTPRHEHDCDCCTFTGTYGDYDLYHCPKSDEGTIIARFGIDGDYYSRPLSLCKSSMSCDHPLSAALAAYKEHTEQPVTIGDLIKRQMDESTFKEEHLAHFNKCLNRE